MYRLNAKRHTDVTGYAIRGKDGKAKHITFKPGDEFLELSADDAKAFINSHADCVVFCVDGDGKDHPELKKAVAKIEREKAKAGADKPAEGEKPAEGQGGEGGTGE